MNNILIGGLRKEIGKLFELLLWQPDRTFSTAYSLERCMKQARTLSPDLLIIDSGIDSQERCFDALAELKETAATADIPIVLLTSAGEEGQATERLLLVADDHIPEPFNPAEIKTISEQFI
jgi:putative two-component system response regulator